MGSGNLNKDQSTITTEDIVAEAQRRLQEKTEPQQQPSQLRTWAVKLNYGVYWLSKYWLAIFNTIVGLYTVGACLTPFLMHFGFEKLAHILYAFYKPFCHQYPFRSWFLFGSDHIHTYPLMEPMSVPKMNLSSSFVGNTATGYKMALCQRDIAMYGIIFLAGLAYGLLRPRKKIRPLPMWIYFTFGIVAIMLDGGIQWLSYLIWVLFPKIIAFPFETIPLMRVLTGALFGLGMIATSYPYINEYFDEIKETLERKFHWT